MNIYDIAKKSGVSIATVSRYINKSGYVGRATAEKLRAIIAAEGYTPSAAAKNLSSGTSFKLIGLICYNIDDLYYAKAVSVLEKELKKSGYEMILSCTGESITEKKSAVSMLIAKSVDAIIFIGSVFMEMSGEIINDTAQKVPCFLINAQIAGENIYCAFCDDRAAVRDAAEALLLAGCRAPVFLYDVETYGSREKRQGFSDAFPGGAIIRVPESYDEILTAFSDIYTDRRPDAVICSNDLIASAVLSFARRNNIAVPARLKIIGHNNSLIAKCTAPELSSIDNQVKLLAEITSQNLVALFEDGSAPQSVNVPYVLKRRESF